MIAFDTSYLVDYLDGVAATRAFLDVHGEGPFFAPSLALFEVYRGACRAEGLEGLERVTDALDWIEPLPLTEAAAREAAVVESELLDAGERINLGDVLVAGICRERGARIVTRDVHFDRVDSLDVASY